MIWQVLSSFYCALFGVCEQGECRVVEHAKIENIVCSYDVGKVDVGLFLNDKQGQPYARIGRLKAALSDDPVMLMNGGMYQDDLSAVGLYVEKAVQSKRISTKDGWGNFHLLPNGVFWGKDGKLGVTETKRFIALKIKPDFATQSGPMLVINGKLHPRFLKDSDSLKIRNGVGVSKDGKQVHFALSKNAINFWEFGKLFQEKLGSHNALFLDGSVSAIATKDYSYGGWRELGPMIGVFSRTSP